MEPYAEAKETYYIGKRDLLHRQKRPITWTEATLDTDEALCRGERDILYRQKRPIVET
jgi:hypothetical protein